VIISDLVKDWGGFEKLIAELHETGEVTVEHNATLIGKSGAPRQIDVLIRHKQGLYDHLVIAECKYWNSPVERLHIDALATAIQDVGASRGVLFSTKGFQSGAITQAKQNNIDLFTVRDLTAEEWGLPGRVIDFYLQVIQPSIGNPVFHAPLVVGVPSNEPIAINLEFDGNGPLSTTPLMLADGTIGKKSLEVHFAESAEKALSQAMDEASSSMAGPNARDTSTWKLTSCRTVHSSSRWGRGFWSARKFPSIWASRFLKLASPMIARSSINSL